jgi:hypothetical protein
MQRISIAGNPLMGMYWPVEIPQQDLCRIIRNALAGAGYECCDQCEVWHNTSGMVLNPPVDHGKDVTYLCEPCGKETELPIAKCKTCKVLYFENTKPTQYYLRCPNCGVG